MKISTTLIVVILLVLGGGFLVLLSVNRSQNTTITAKGLPVLVEVFSDYNCPHCADFSPFVEDVEKTFGEKVKVEKKHSPFLASSSNSYAYAAESARLQSKFNEFNKALFAWISFKRDPANTIFEYTDEDRSFYSNEVNVTELARRLELDIDKFESDRKSNEIVRIVNEQKADLIKRAGAVSTPAVYIYGENFTLSTYEDLKTKVQELVNEIETSPVSSPQ